MDVVSKVCAESNLHVCFIIMNKHERSRTEKAASDAHADRSEEWHRKNAYAGGREDPTYSSERVGYGVTGILKFTQKQTALHGMGSYCSPPVATHVDFVSKVDGDYV